MEKKIHWSAGHETCFHSLFYEHSLYTCPIEDRRRNAECSWILNLAWYELHLLPQSLLVQNGQHIHENLESASLGAHPYNDNIEDQKLVAFPANAFFLQNRNEFSIFIVEGSYHETVATQVISLSRVRELW